MTKGDLQAAEPELRRALELQRQYLGSSHPEIAGTLATLARIHRRRGEFSAAEELYREAIELRSRFLPADHPSIIENRNGLAFALEGGGKIVEGGEERADLVRITRAKYGDNHPTVATYTNNLASNVWWQGDRARAEELLRAALEIRLDYYGERHYTVAQSNYTLGRLYTETGRLDEAERSFRTAIEINARTDIPETALPRVALALVLKKKGEYVEAERWARSGYETLSAAYPATHMRVGRALAALGGALLGLGQLEEAQPALIDALAVLEDGRRADTELVSLLEDLVELYRRLGDDAQAEAYVVRLGELLDRKPV